MKRIIIALALVITCFSATAAMDTITSPALASDAAITTDYPSFELSKGEALTFKNSNVDSMTYMGPLSSSMAHFTVKMPGKPDFSLRIARNTSFTLGGAKFHMTIDAASGKVLLDRI